MWAHAHRVWSRHFHLEDHILLIKAEDIAYGRWAEILAAAGVDSSFLRNGKQCPCPFCGGTDRYRWTEKNGGLYICNHCTVGKYKSGFDLLMRHLGITFQDAAKHVRDHFNIGTGVQGEKAFRELAARAPAVLYKADPEKALARMRKQWDEARPVTTGDAVDLYLRRRIPGLQAVPEEIRMHPALPYWLPPDHRDGKPTLLGNFPAMLVRGFDAAGDLVQLHKTYLTGSGQKAEVPHPKKTDVGVGSNSFALRMGVPSDTLGVSEGIETALASSLLRGVPVWPCHSASIMANFQMPQGMNIKKLIIFADTDQLKDGRRAGEDAAKRLSDTARKAGVRTLIIRPAKVGTDFADLVGA